MGVKLIPDLGAGGWQNQTRDEGPSLVCGESDDFLVGHRRCHEGLMRASASR